MLGACLGGWLSSYLILSCLVLSCLVQPYLVLSSLILSSIVTLTPPLFISFRLPFCLFPLRLGTISMLRYFPRTTQSPSSEPLPGLLGSVNEEVPLVLTSQSPSGPTTAMLSILASQAEDSQFLLDEGKSPKKKRKYTEQKKFACKIKELTGLELEPAPDKNNRSANHCMSCCKGAKDKIHINNVTDRWIRHAKICSGLKASQRNNLAPPLSGEAQNFVMHVVAGGDAHPNPNPIFNPNSK